MTEKDLGEVEKIEELIIETYRNEREPDEYISDGRLTAIAQAILTYIRQEEVKLLESLKQEIKSSSDIYYEERKFNDLIQQAISRIEKGE